MKRIVFTMAILLVMLSSLCYAKQKVEDNSIVYNYNQKVYVGNGTVNFTNLRIYRKKEKYINTYDIYIFGTVSNNTNQNWDKLTFDIHYLGDFGQIIYTGDLIIHNFNTSSIKTIGYSKTSLSNDYDVVGLDYTTNSNIDMKRVKNIRIDFKSGELSGKPHVILTEPYVNNDLKYSDSVIDVSFKMSQYDSNIDLLLMNKTNSPIKIDWNQVSFVSMSGKAVKVIHEGIKLINSGEMQAPTYIPPKATLSDIIAPTSNFYWNKGWEYIPILPKGQAALSSVGQTFSVYLPMEINGQLKHYNFVFKIDSAEN